jgi:hypothetical protein
MPLFLSSLLWFFLLFFSFIFIPLNISCCVLPTMLFHPLPFNVVVVVFLSLIHCEILFFSQSLSTYFKVPSHK